MKASLQEGEKEYSNNWAYCDTMAKATRSILVVFEPRRKQESLVGGRGLTVV